MLSKAPFSHLKNIFLCGLKFYTIYRVQHSIFDI